MSGWLSAVVGSLATMAIAALVWLAIGLVRRRRAARRRGAWSSGGARGGSRGAQDIERLFRDAEEKLRRSPDLRNFGIRDLPVYLLVGDEGSGKTSLILNSGLQSELLAGQNRQGAPVTSTETLNIWLINGCIVIEVPARIWKDNSLEAVLLRRLRYPALKMAFGRRRIAPRSVIACIPADQLGSGAGLGTSVAPLNEFLLLASRQLGIALPVYAVLTRADGISGFREIFFNLKPEEATEVLGASLDADQLTDRATYSELAQGTLNDACQNLVTFLQTRRTSLLVREYELERAWAGYEFPRRLERIRPSLVKALADLCNPSLIQTSPILRGFYFTGVRRTLRQEGASLPYRSLSDSSDVLSATRMFRPGALPAQVPRPSAGTEEVDEWAFSQRLLREVIFADPAAVSVSGHSQFRDVYRAILCWVGAGLAMAVICGEMVSYGINSNLERSLTATGAVARQSTVPVNIILALDKYREPVNRLIDYKDNVPLSMRWGLYQGGTLFPPAQRQFCADAKRAVVVSAVQSMERQLAQGKTSGDYDSLYRMLKAELMISVNPEKADTEFLAGELAARAIQNGPIAPGAASALEPILRTYSRLVTMPEQQEYCLVRADPAVVRQARAYLREASAEEKIYSDLLSKAGRGIASADYNKLHPNEAVRELNKEGGSYVVSSSFTAGAWVRMQAYLNQPEKLVSTETWVVGESASARPDLHALSGRLRTRYATEYGDRWRQYLASGIVAHFASLDDAARKLDLITSGNQSPLLWLFSLATEHTSGGEPVAQAFQPVREVVSKAGDFTSGMPYLNQLIGIKALLPNAAHLTGPPRDQAFDQIRQAATQARIVVEQLAQKFRTDVGPQVRTLLLQPILQVEELLNSQGAADMAGASAGVCAPYNAINSKFPFQADALEEADPEQVLNLLKPNEGPVWKLYQSTLADSLDLGASGFMPKLNPRVPLRKEFISFMNRVWAQSRIYYATPDDPGFRLTLHAPPSGVVRSIDIYIDDQHFPLAPGGTTTISWSLRRYRQLRLAFQFAGIQEPPQNLNGPWALLHWLNSAENPSSQPLEWMLRSGRLVRQMDNGSPMIYRLDVRFADGTPFDIRKLAGVRCPAATTK